MDFLIIGGGMAGISVAARLSHLGGVAVFEPEDALGYHASGRSAAMFEETYGKPSTIALNRTSKAYHADANGGVLRARGCFWSRGRTKRKSLPMTVKPWRCTRSPWTRRDP